MYHMRVRLPMTLGRPFLFRHILGGGIHEIFTDTLDHG